MKRSVEIGLIATAAILTMSVGAKAQTGAVSDDVVKIGVLTDMSGQFSHESGEGAVTAIKMAVEDFGGKVLGKPIEVIVADHQNKPDTASALARKWFDVEKVDMIGNLINSSIALTVSGLAKDKNRIAIINGSGSSRLTGDACTPNSIHYSYDTYALARGTGTALAKEGKKSWYFLTADYAFGHALEADTSAVVKAMGGEVVGSTRYPPESFDQSSFLLQAQSSKAQVVALAGSGNVLVNSIKSAQEFGIQQHQTLAGLLVWETDIKALGLSVAKGLVLTNAFYWDRDDETRAWSKRFFDRMKVMPHMGDAGDYSSTMHYLRAVEAAGTDEAQAVMKKMREMPINDFFAKNGRIREDGRMVHDMYVYEVKKPSESKGDWDFYKLREVIPGDQAFRPLKESTCPLVRKG
ncbi:branched-chain amino acid transport system substrate-binding protein [Bradyrhizobium sp. SBR1B]|nr:branched-chain amino acid transport system substrate-binding protein [Bradyrhizobium sp. SBR1B]